MGPPAEPSTVQRTIVALRSRRWIVLLVAASMVVPLAWATSRLEMEQDPTRLFPSLSAKDQRALDVLARSRLFDRLYVELGGSSPDDLASAATRIADRLESDERIEAVESRVTAEQEQRTASLVFEHRFQLLEPDGELDRRLDPVEVRRRVKLARARLLGPMSGMGERIRRDPLDLVVLARSRMTSGLVSGRVRMYGGHPFTPDLDRCLLVVAPATGSMQVDDAGALVDDVRAAVERETGAGIRARLTGAHVFSSASARTVKSDALRSFGIALACIVLIFIAYFRRPAPLLLGLLPSAAGVLTGFAISAILLGSVSGIAVGFGSIVVGISVDYAIHTLRESLDRPAGPVAGEAAGRALARILPSLLTGWATTAVVFAFYGISSFPLVRELGVFAGSGVTAGFLVTLIVLPLFAGDTRSRRTVGAADPLGTFLSRLSGMGTPASVAIVASSVVVIVTAALLVPRLVIEDDVRKLDWQDPEVVRFHEEFEERWLGPGEGRVLIVSGDTLEDALARNEELLVEADASLSSISGFLPSHARQLERLERLAERDWEAVRGAVEIESAALGFRPGWFDPFFEDLDAALAGENPLLDLDDLDGTPMSHLARASIVRLGDEVHVLSFVPESVPIDELPRRDGAIVTSRTEIMNRVFESVRTEVLRLVAVSLLGILLVLLLRYRRLGPALASMAPVVLACAATVVLFALAQIELNAIAVLSFTLILGVGLDYGIFMVDALGRRSDPGPTAGAVLISGLTTLASFGILAGCRNPVLHGIGRVVLVGVIASLMAALALVPAIRTLARRSA